MARVAALLVSVSLVAACGGDDDDAGDATAAPETTAPDADEAAAATTEATSTITADESPTTTAGETTIADEPSSMTDDGLSTEAPSDDDDDPIEIDDFDDLPAECRDLFADFLRQIEPIVSEVDWENATMADFESLTDQLDVESGSFDAQIAEANCDDYELGESPDSIQAMIDFAEDEAPGAVGYLEYLASFLEDLSGLDGGTGGAGAADVPTDCDGAIAYVDALIAEHDTMMEMPVADMMSVSTAITTISSECSPERSQEFFTRTDVTEFMSA
jgi:hypothetical protein